MMIKRIITLIFFVMGLLQAAPVRFTQEELQFIQKNQPITVGSMDTYTPFSFMKDNKKVGFTQDLLEIISQKSGLKFDVVDGSWPEIYDLFYEGKIDMISEFSHRKERMPFTLFTSSYYEIPIGVFTRIDFGDYNGIESLFGKRIGVVKNSYIIPILHEEGVDVIEFNNADERFIALSEGMIDVVITNAMNVYKFEQMMLTNIKLAGRFVHPKTKNEDLRFGIRIEQPLLHSIIDKTLKSIPFSTISQLKQDWILNLNKSILKLTVLEKQFRDNSRIKVGIEQAKPYIFYNEEKKKNDGLYFDVLQKVLEKTGLKVQYVYKEWSVLLQEFKEGKIDLLPSAFYSKDREKFGYFSDAYYKLREYIYVRSDNQTVFNFRDLQHKKVAIIKGYATINKIKKVFPSIEVVETQNIAQSTAMLLNGEVDAMIDYHLVVENYLRDNSIIGLKGIAQHQLKPISVHFLSQKSKPVLNTLLQKGLDHISREEMNTVLQKWVHTSLTDENQAFSLTKEEQEFMIKHQTIRFAVISNRPPFEFVQNNKPAGIAVDYIKKSAKNMGLDIEFVVENMTNTDAYAMIEGTRDHFDTVLMSVKNKQREKRFSYGETFLSYPMMIITYEKHPYIGSLKDLNNKKVAMEKGFLSTQRLRSEYPEITIVEVNNTQEALQLVNDEKVNAYVGNVAVANYMSVSGEMKNLKIAAPSGYDNIEYRFIAPKEWPELVSILTKGFNQITPSEHSAIQQKWFSLQTIERTNYELIWQIIAVVMVVLIWVLGWNRILASQKKETQKALQLVQEKTEQLKQKNIEVQESKKFLESVLDETPDPIMIKSVDGEFLLVNEAIATLYNSTPAQMQGEYDWAFDAAEEVNAFFNQNLDLVVQSGQTRVQYEQFVNTKENKTYDFITTKKPFFNEKGETLILIIANDITAIKKLENEQIRQKEMLLNQSKIAAMGEMLGNISHQWRQPLSVITTQASGVKVWIEFGAELSNERLLECAQSIIDQANYLSKTIDDFKNFFISDSTTTQVHDLKNVMTKLENLIKVPYENNFIKRINDIEDEVYVELNENILIQALVNIYNNTKDAFTIQEINSDQRYLFASIKKEEDEAVLTFQDSAGGIEPKNLDKIFEPYFTTKHQSIGTGIGLYMTNQIITKHLKGNIEVSNESFIYEGKALKGAKFVFRLPLKH